MKVLRSEVLAKLNEWSLEDFDGVRGVWTEMKMAEGTEQTFNDFCMKVAAQNVLFAKLEEAGELA